MNIADFIILAVIAVLLFLAIRYSIRHKHRCCGDCSKCSSCGACSRKDMNK